LSGYDSGFGGLSIFKEIEKKLPNYDYIYLGDNKRAPYGHLEQDVIYQYTKEAVDYLFYKGANLVILACNTASAEALRKIQQEYLPKHHSGKNVLGVIRPLAEEASKNTKNKTVAVMATQSTVESDAFSKELKAIDDSIEVKQQACPLLVPMIEESREDHPSTKIVLDNYVDYLKKHSPDTVVLGCTHYAWVERFVKGHFTAGAKILSSGKVVAEKLAEYLKRHPEYAEENKVRPRRTFLTTNSTDKFDLAAQKFLGRIIKSKQVKI